MGNDNNAIGELDLRYKWLEDILLMEQRVGNYKYKEKKKKNQAWRGKIESEMEDEEEEEGEENLRK